MAGAEGGHAAAAPAAAAVPTFALTVAVGSATLGGAAATEETQSFARVSVVTHGRDNASFWYGAATGPEGEEDETAKTITAVRSCQLAV